MDLSQIKKNSKFCKSKNNTVSKNIFLIMYRNNTKKDKKIFPNLV